jgi:hypothetical protein
VNNQTPLSSFDAKDPTPYTKQLKMRKGQEQRQQKSSSFYTLTFILLLYIPFLSPFPSLISSHLIYSPHPIFKSHSIPKNTSPNQTKPNPNPNTVKPHTKEENIGYSCPDP